MLMQGFLLIHSKPRTLRKNDIISACCDIFLGIKDPSLKMLNVYKQNITSFERWITCNLLFLCF
jgi:hypothetical protein